MLRVKHFLDRVEPEDGYRLWVEAIGVTRDLRELCSIQHVLSHLGPPVALWMWYEEHEQGFEYFRSKYLKHLADGPHREALLELGSAARREHFTLLHQSDDPIHNTASVLAEFINSLQPHSSRGT